MAHSIAARRFSGESGADWLRFISSFRESYGLSYRRGTVELLPRVSEAPCVPGVQTWLVAFAGTVLDPLTRQAINLTGSDEGRYAVDVPSGKRRLWESRLRYLETIDDGAPAREYEAARTILRSLVLDCLRLARVDADPHAPGFQTLQCVLLFIERNFRRKLSLREIAQTVNFSPAYLTDLVRRETGMPIYRWVTHYRLAEAKRLLESTELPLSAIAAQIGFADNSYFCRRFTKSVGVTPSAWRRSHALMDGRTPERTHSATSPEDQATLRLVIDRIPHIVWIRDRDGSLLYANRRWYEYTGLTAEQSRGWGWLAAVQPDQISRILARWHAARVTGEEVKYSVLLRRGTDAAYCEHVVHGMAYGDAHDRWFGTATATGSV